MGRRDPFLLDRDLDRYRKLQPHLFPELEKIPDLSRYQLRLAAEVALAIIKGPLVSLDQMSAFRSARVIAFEVLDVLAKG